jgi:hypothetical protein
MTTIVYLYDKEGKAWPLSLPVPLPAGCALKISGVTSAAASVLQDYFTVGEGALSGASVSELQNLYVLSAKLRVISLRDAIEAHLQKREARAK